MENEAIVVTEINDKIHKFYDKAYGSKHILHNLAHLKWQFKNNPFHKNECYSLIIIENTEKIKSHLGYIPVELKILNKNILALWHVSFFTLEERLKLLPLGFIFANFNNFFKCPFNSF